MKRIKTYESRLAWSAEQAAEMDREKWIRDFDAWSAEQAAEMEARACERGVGESRCGHPRAVIQPQSAAHQILQDIAIGPVLPC